ncbi:thiamine phosphate synthase [Sinomicrobium weinanense]|uniref:Thiamine phosphate synthase n=1 Tax=Sinomicrobium weinanense TaxID=2842200 RepID=A0A926Q4Y3_9FLAO|nr:thiamine phosphate synthase [Sinomicrobium weinanense]MBC9798489.1 thiamine phosphate synthase [Sinomicrobium weinanense]MBU3125236.1 thiamine phosphate synthase [Sinomicrobium weinanense]
MHIPGHIVITKPDNSPDEIARIIRMFRVGLDVLHLRKPGISGTELLHFLQNIPEKYHCRIVVHQHYEMIAKFGLKGIHLPERARESYGKDLKRWLLEYRKKGFSVSTSFHTVRDIKFQMKHAFDYAFLSPVFDSISKTGHQGRLFDLSEKKLPFPIIALGGITPRHIPRLKKMGFSGAASLGYVWNSEDPVKAYKGLQVQCSTLQLHSG